MSRHAGIDPSENTFDVSELNLTNKKYVDDALKLKVDKAGDDMTGPLGMNNGKIWDLGDPTLPGTATNKKYVDEQITTLTSSVNDEISDVDIVDEDFVAGADSQIRVVSRIVNAHQNKLLSSQISNGIEKHFHMSYSGKATGFGTTGGKAVIVSGGFGSIDGRCTYAAIKLRGMG